MNRFDNPPAFPRAYSRQPPGDDDRAERAHEGMTLRDWFAGEALPVVAMPNSFGEKCTDPRQLAALAYKLADAMLEERQK